MGIGFVNNSGYSALVLAVVATAAVVCLPSATAGRLELINELSGLKGREGVLTVRCWSRNDRMGQMTIMPGESRSWAFKTVRLWPLLYTEFRCEFGTKFGFTRERNIVVFEADKDFLMECDYPRGDECVWVAKNDGLYLRTKVDWFSEPRYTDVIKSKWASKNRVSIFD